MKSALQIQQEIDQKNAQVEAIIACCKDSDREPSTEEQEVIDSFYGSDGVSGELAGLESSLKNRNAIEQRQKEIAANKLGGALRRQQSALSNSNIVPATARRHGPLTAFSSDEQGERDAYMSGRWLMAKLFNHEPSKQFLREHGMIKAQQEETATQGLELVPEPLEAAILKRLTMLSTILQKVRTSTMTSATLKVPDRLTGVTVYYPDENTAITASHMTFGQQLLTSRKMATLTQCSSELVEDSVISIMDELASDIAYSIALKIEDDIVNGDGTGTYGGVTGLAGSIGANSTVTGAGVTSQDFTLANYEACVALNPFFQGAMPEWYCSSAVWANSMLPLLNASLGTPGSEVSAGYARQFMGFPVNILQTMSTGGTISTDCVYFGTMSQSVYYGTRRGISIATSEHFGFDSDSIYIRGTTRNAITVDNHDGSVAGPITAIATAAA